MFGIIVSLTKEPRSPQHFRRAARSRAACRHGRIFLLNANRNAKHGKDGARCFTLRSD
jgi:hypothetical protein